MAMTTLNSAQNRTAGFGRWLARVADRFGTFLVRLGEASEGAAAAREAARLSALGDDELARLGIERKNIVEHTFRHLANR